MKTLNLTDEQYNLLRDIALNEMGAIDGSITDGCLNEHQHADAIEAYDTLADLFGFVRWEYREKPYTLGDLIREYIDSHNEDDS